MADIDIRELSHQVLPEAVLNRPSPRATYEHAQAVKEVAKEAASGPQELDTHFILPDTQAEAPRRELFKITIERNIEGDKSTGVLVRSKEQTRRVNQATEAADLAFTVLEKGYHNLTQGQKRQVQERVLPAVRRLWPELNTVMAGLTTRERQELMDDILQDPAFHQELNNALVAIQQEELGESHHSDYEEKQHHLDELEKQREQIEKDLYATRNKLQEFKEGSTKGKALTELHHIDAAREAQERHLKFLKDEYDSKKSMFDRVSRYEGKESGKEDQIDMGRSASRLREELDALRKLMEKENQRLVELQAQLSLRKDMKDEKEKAEKDQHDKERDLESLEKQIHKLEKEVLTAKADLGISKLNKAAHEEKFVHDIQQVFGKAAEQVIRKRAKAADDARKRMLEQKPNKVLSAAMKRYLDESGNYKKDLINHDYRQLIETDFTDVVKTTLVQQGGMSEREAAHFLETDKESAQRAKNTIATEVAKRFVQAGGIITEEDLRRLEATGMGIEIAKTANESTKSLMDQVKPSEEQSTSHDTHQQESSAVRNIFKKLFGGSEHSDRHDAHGSSDGGHSAKDSHGSSKESHGKSDGHDHGHAPGRKLNKKRIFLWSLLGASAFFGGPSFLNFAIPQVYKAWERWKQFEVVDNAARDFNQGVDILEDKITSLASREGGSLSDKISSAASHIADVGENTA